MKTVMNGGIRNMQGISLLVKELSALQEGPCSTDLVNLVGRSTGYFFWLCYLVTLFVGYVGINVAFFSYMTSCIVAD